MLKVKYGPFVSEKERHTIKNGVILLKLGQPYYCHKKIPWLRVTVPIFFPASGLDWKCHFVNFFTHPAKTMDARATRRMDLEAPNHGRVTFPENS
jgi:hypothetical protein